MITSPTAARAAGIRLVANGFSSPRAGTIRAVHALGSDWNTTLCGKTLSEPNRIGTQQYLGQFRLCIGCQHKLETAEAAKPAVTPTLADLAGLLRSVLNYMDQEDNAELWNQAWEAVEAVEPELTKPPF